MRKRITGIGTALAAGILLFLTAGCDFVVQPLGGSEGRTQVYVAAGKLGAPNAGIVCTRIGCVVIDPMLSPTVSASLHSQALAKSRIFWDNVHAQRKERARTQAPPVLYVLNTTFRGTHTFGNQEFDKADIISTTKAKDRLEADGRNMREELRDQWKVPGLDTHAITPATLTVDGMLTLDTPEVKIQFISMGDCTGEGDAVVYLPGQKVLFAGDMVIPGFMPYFKGRTPTVRRWIEALKTMEKWEVETVVPGHGEVAKKDAIKQQREFLEALVKEVEAVVKAGKSMEDAAQTVKLPAFSKWTRYDEWLPENVKLVFRELKGGPAQAEQKNAGGPGVGMVEPRFIEKPDSFRDK
ncbi:MAG: MBL fold metallo-hydrolase [Planctomycetota bacterium]|nr:MBL fold metallo-hydrolase [Planctomycetota bacterium]